MNTSSYCLPEVLLPMITGVTRIVGTATQREEHEYRKKDNDSYREPPEIHTPHIYHTLGGLAMV